MATQRADSLTVQARSAADAVVEAALRIERWPNLNGAFISGEPSRTNVRTVGPLGQWLWSVPLTWPDDEA
jgi:hypothetical protein